MTTETTKVNTLEAYVPLNDLELAGLMFAVDEVGEAVIDLDVIGRLIATVLDRNAKLGQPPCAICSCACHVDKPAAGADWEARYTKLAEARIRTLESALRVAQPFMEGERCNPSEEERGIVHRALSPSGGICSGGSPSEDMRRRLCATIEERDRQIEAMHSRESQLVQRINGFHIERTRHATLVAKLKAALVEP